MGAWKRAEIVLLTQPFTGGTVIFSGSLYLLTLTGVRSWGAVTPFGGVSLIVGWVMLGVAAVRRVYGGACPTTPA